MIDMQNSNNLCVHLIVKTIDNGAHLAQWLIRYMYDHMLHLTNHWAHKRDLSPE